MKINNIKMLYGNRAVFVNKTAAIVDNNLLIYSNGRISLDKYLLHDSISYENIIILGGEQTVFINTVTGNIVKTRYDSIYRAGGIIAIRNKEGGIEIYNSELKLIDTIKLKTSRFELTSEIEATKDAFIVLCGEKLENIRLFRVIDGKCKEDSGTAIEKLRRVQQKVTKVTELENVYKLVTDTDSWLIYNDTVINITGYNIKSKLDNKTTVILENEGDISYNYDNRFDGDDVEVRNIIVDMKSNRRIYTTDEKHSICDKSKHIIIQEGNKLLLLDYSLNVIMNWDNIEWHNIESDTNNEKIIQVKISIEGKIKKLIIYLDKEVSEIV